MLPNLLVNHAVTVCFRLTQKLEYETTMYEEGRTAPQTVVPGSGGPDKPFKVWSHAPQNSRNSFSNMSGAGCDREAINYEITDQRLH